MKAIQIITPGQIEVTELTEPVVHPENILIKVKYAGFCGSDLNTYLGRNPMVKLPVVPGHEIGGEIVMTGTEVPAAYQPGMACTVNPYTACGQCSSCRQRRPNACKYNQTMGVQRHGGMAEFISVPWQKVIVDSGLTAKQFALVEPLSVGFHAVSRAQVSDLDYVMVIGCGMIGLGAIIRSSLRGANVIAVDVDDRKLEFAKRLGAVSAINSLKENVAARLAEITCGNGPDVTIEAVGSPATYQMAVNETAFCGRVVCIGYAKDEVAFETKYFVMKELNIMGSRNALPEDFRAVIEYMKRPDNLVLECISGIYRPEQIHEAMKKWSERPGEIYRIFLTFTE